MIYQIEVVFVGRYEVVAWATDRRDAEKLVPYYRHHDGGKPGFVTVRIRQSPDPAWEPSEAD